MSRVLRWGWLCVALLASGAAVGQGAPSLNVLLGHGLASRADGSVLAWGFNDHGQLGNGEMLYSFSPREMPGIPAARHVTAGYEHAVALGSDGRVYSWGANWAGQLGDGTRQDRVVPRAITGLSNVRSICAAYLHSMAVTSDGALWIWGSNHANAFGDGATTQSLVPRRVPGIGDVAAIDCTETTIVALRLDGSVWAWGQDLGRPSPQPMSGLADVRAISAGRTSFAVKRDGSVWGWGFSDFGQLASDDPTYRLNAVQVPGVLGVTQVASAGQAIFAVREDGSVLSWGDKGGLEWPNAVADRPRRPEPIPGITDAVAIAAGGHVLVLHRSKRVSAWGYNGSGALGLGTEGDRDVPTQVPGLQGVTGVWVGGDMSFASLEDGRLFAWGGNEAGRLGVERLIQRARPVRVVGLTEVVQVAAGGNFSLAVKRDGTAWSWGENRYGQLGDGTLIERSAPVRIALPPNVASVAAGWDFPLAVLRDGSVWTWSIPAFDLVAASDILPVPIPGLSGVVSVAAGDRHGLALRQDGTVWSFGANHKGQLGRAGLQAPAQVPGLAAIAFIATGGESSYAVGRDGSLWAWGNNEFGQLGDGTTTDRDSPVRALVDRVTAVASSPAFVYGHTVAARSDGTLWTWGANGWGELGDGTLVDRAQPREVAGLRDVVGVTAGYGYTMVRLAGGGVVGWGNNWGTLADGTFADRPLPGAALGPSGAEPLDLTPVDGSGVPPELLPALAVAATTGKGRDADVLEVQAEVFFRPEDIGRTASLFTFALAPASGVRGGESSDAVRVGMAKLAGRKADTPIACVLAQLNAGGQMVAVTSSNLAAYLTGVLGAQGASVNILNGVPTGNVSGATFFVGYGASGTSMINGGTNRAVVTVPGSMECRPAPPQTGWWWNPAEDGRGYSIEKRGNNLFFAAFLYHPSGRSTWHVSSGPVSLEGSLYNGDLLSASGGQTLGGPYTAFPTLRSEGSMTMTFNNAATGTLVWPGGTVPIQRFNIVPNGLTLPASTNQPESGWWWNEQEAGRGFFMEWQGGTLDIAGYMYDEAGDPVWYLTVGNQSADGRSFSGNWWSYGNGMTLMGPWRPHTRINDNFAPLTITFSGPDTALMTLPNGRTTALRRHRF